MRQKVTFANINTTHNCVYKYTCAIKKQNDKRSQFSGASHYVMTSQSEKTRFINKLAPSLPKNKKTKNYW